MAAHDPNFHESFWIAMAAAGPVIFLAHAVTIDRVFRHPRRRPLNMWTICLPVAGFSFAAAATYMAVDSLSRYRDHATPTTAIWTLGISAALLVAGTLVDWFVRLAESTPDTD